MSGQEAKGLGDGFRKCAAARDGRLDDAGADALTAALRKALLRVEAPYTHKLEEAAATRGETGGSGRPTGERVRHKELFEGLAESVKRLCGELEGLE